METTNRYFIILFVTASACIVSLFYMRSSPEDPVSLPMVINTWHFTNATEKAWEILQQSNKDEAALDAVEQGCSVCEREQCDGTVGYGGSPDENGETTLDAMIMDGRNHDVGAVGALRGIKNAISVARRVLENTEHTLLVGSQATEFALNLGFKAENLTTDSSSEKHRLWKLKNCQPNFWKNVFPSPTTSCGPYTPTNIGTDSVKSGFSKTTYSKLNHDTIGMIAIDKKGRIAGGTSTNGAINKIPGRVGDSPIPGSGCYVDRKVGGAAATGDGDVMMRLLPAMVAVEGMRLGLSPDAAAQSSLRRVVEYYPKFEGAVIAVAIDGSYGAACNGFSYFEYSVANDKLGGVKVKKMKCL